MAECIYYEKTKRVNVFYSLAFSENKKRGKRSVVQKHNQLRSPSNLGSTFLRHSSLATSSVQCPEGYHQNKNDFQQFSL